MRVKGPTGNSRSARRVPAGPRSHWEGSGSLSHGGLGAAVEQNRRQAPTGRGTGGGLGCEPPDR